MGNGEYIDTYGSKQGSSFTIALADETPTGVNHPGPWKEFAIVPFLYNLYQPAGENLGFVPFHATLTGSFKEADSFTTLYSFLHFLKAAYPGQKSAIETRASNLPMDIDSSHDQFDGPDYIEARKPFKTAGATDRRYTNVTPDGTVVAADVDGDRPEVYDDYGTQGLNGNKLYNRLFFKTTLPLGTYTIRATRPMPMVAVIAAT